MSWSLCTHAPFVVDGTAEPCTRLDARGAPGERIALSFDLVTGAAPLHAVVSASRLTSTAGVIDRDAIDVRVVVRRTRAGVGVHRAAAIDVPELLLKDDRVAPKGRYSRHCGHLRHLHRARYGARHYVAPDVRLSGDAVISVAPFARRQLWLTVRLRRGLAPGLYAGAIEIGALAAGSRRSVATTIALTIDVLPIALADPPQRRMLWFRGTLDCARPQFHLDADRFLQQLIDIREHGFNSVSLGESSLPRLRHALGLARAAGFRDVVLQPPLPAHLTRRDLADCEVTCYVSDEIDQRGPAYYASHRANRRAADRLGLATMTSLVRERFVARLSELQLGARPDLVSLYLPSNLDYIKAAAAFPELRHRGTLYYWMAGMDKPNVHRVLAGFYLWKSGAAGISPYCYQHRPASPHDPYEDMADGEPGATVGTGAEPVKPQMATYPARGGSLPTLRWEGLGEGLTDLRYLATVESLLTTLRESRQAGVEPLCREVAARLRALADRLPLASVQIADPVEAEPYPHLDACDYARFRTGLADDAVALSCALAGTASHRPQPAAVG